jgi:hypothetical protein
MGRPDDDRAVVAKALEILRDKTVTITEGAGRDRVSVKTLRQRIAAGEITPIVFDPDSPRPVLVRLWRDELRSSQPA